MIGALAAYLTAHPSHKSADLTVTPDGAKTLHANLSNARLALETQATNQKAAKTASDKATDQLRKRFRSTIAELDMLLARDSLVWGAFGLTPPAQKSRRNTQKETTPTETGLPVSVTRPVIPVSEADKNIVSLAV